MDKQLLGKTTTDMMDWLDDIADESEIVSVGIAVVIGKEGRSRMMTFCSDNHFHHKIGLFVAAADCCRNIVADYEDDE